MTHPILYILAVYGGLRLLQDFIAWGKRNAPKHTQIAAAQQYGMTPVHGHRETYQDPNGQHWSFQNGSFHPTSVTDFEIMVRGRTTSF